LAALTRQQIRVWHDSLTLWEHTLAVAGESATAYANLAETLENQGDLVNATRYYRKSADLAPDKVQGHVNLGNALQKTGRLDEAAAEFDTIIRIAPDSPVGYTNLGLLRLGQKRCDEAASLLDQANDRRPDAEKNLGYVNRASVEEARDQFDVAAEYYGRALKVQPDDAKALAGLGVCLLRLKRPTEAIDSLRKSVAADPEFARGRYLLGMALRTVGDLEGSAEQFKEEIRVSTNKAKGWYNLGIIRGEQKRFADALQCFETSLQYDPSSTSCRAARDQVLRALQGNGRAP
jgi:superkiller protein 3